MILVSVLARSYTSKKLTWLSQRRDGIKFFQSISYRLPSTHVFLIGSQYHPNVRKSWSTGSSQSTSSSTQCLSHLNLQVH